jgi:hypothetical protein
MDRECLERMARERGYTVHERHLDIYYSSLGRSYDETFLTVKNGERALFEFNQAILEEWVDEAYVTRLLDKVNVR